MKKTILLIDDEKDVLTIMGGRIRKWGYDLIEATGGKEAIEAIKKGGPDIVVLDYIMPEMDGVSTLKEIRKINNKIPVIMFTAFSDKKSIKGTEKLGVTAYIPKMSMFSPGESSLEIAVKMAEKNLGNG